MIQKRVRLDLSAQLDGQDVMHQGFMHQEAIAHEPTLISRALSDRTKSSDRQEIAPRFKAMGIARDR